MGFMKPKMYAPPPDPELEKLKKEEAAAAAKSLADAEARKVEQERKKKSNLLGTKSLQSTEAEGFAGFRTMGSKDINDPNQIYKA
jgi:hypothetical protein